MKRLSRVDREALERAIAIDRKRDPMSYKPINRRLEPELGTRLVSRPPTLANALRCGPSPGSQFPPTNTSRLPMTTASMGR